MKWLKKIFGRDSGSTQKPAEDRAAFMLRATAADQAWMQANTKAQTAALQRGDQEEYKRLYDEKAERLRLGNKDLWEYYQKYYSHLRRS